MSKVFLKTFGVSFLSLSGVFVILAITIFFPQGGGEPGSGEGWGLLFFIVGVGPIFLAVSAVISLIIAAIFGVVSRGQTTQPGNENTFNSSRIALYTIIIILALFAGYLKYSGL